MQLAWGRRYVMVRPDHFRVDYQINPFMDLADQPDPAAPARSGTAWSPRSSAAGGEVEVIEQRPTPPTWSTR